MEPLSGETWVGGCRVSCVCIASGQNVSFTLGAGTGKVWRISGVLGCPPGVEKKITERE